MTFLSRLFRGRPKVLPESVRDLDGYGARVLSSELPVIVDVWSATCPPCKQLEPVLIDIATRFADRVRVVEIGIGDADPALVAKLGVRATPTLIIVHEGKELGRESGYRPASWFEQMIEAEFPKGGG